MKSNSLTRREALRGGISLLTGAVLVACGKKELRCFDTAGLTAAEIQNRTNLKYVDATPDPAKPCEGCQFYTPAAPDQCGGCTVLKGPIHPRGYCTSWAPKKAV